LGNSSGDGVARRPVNRENNHRFYLAKPFNLVLNAFMKSKIPHTNWVRRSHVRSALLFVSLLIGCFAISPMALTQGEFGNGNTAAGLNALADLTTGERNTALGAAALFSLTTADNNTAIGWRALRANTASHNTATGYQALTNNTTGVNNTAMGLDALRENTTARLNTAVGSNALQVNTTGPYNSAVGAGALAHNTTGTANTALGEQALLRNTIADANTAVGRWAMVNYVVGERNTAVGAYALAENQTRRSNTAIGSYALQNGAGENNTALGYRSGAHIGTGDNNIDIGNEGVAGENGTIRIGSPSQVRTFIAGISGSVVTGAIVQINAAGQLGTAPSAARFKDDIKPMDKASEAVLALKPVTFRYKQKFDPDCTPQFGLVAEEVAKVNPDLVLRDSDGNIHTVRYDAVNAMLLNEFLKEYRHVQEQDVTIARLEKQIEALTVGLQKVSAQLELSKPAPQTVNNP
jgi:hypothetical protein